MFLCVCVCVCVCVCARVRACGVCVRGCVLVGTVFFFSCIMLLNKKIKKIKNKEKLHSVNLPYLCPQQDI